MNADAPMKDTTGRYLTRALFVELTDKEMAAKYPPLCTLGEAHELYLEVCDPTEYEFAKRLLGHADFWAHWLRLLQTPTFLAELHKWREELEVKIRSGAIRQMRESARDPQRGTAAAKWIAEGSWKEKRKVGRPTKEAEAVSKAVEQAIEDDLRKDAERISLLN